MGRFDVHSRESSLNADLCCLAATTAGCCLFNPIGNTDLYYLGALTAGYCFFSNPSAIRGLSTAGLIGGILLLSVGIAGLATTLFSGIGLALLIIGAVLTIGGGMAMSKGYSPSF
jgi:hypothetical protein